MKALSFFFLLVLIALVGCSADDLTGLESATDEAAPSTQTLVSEVARPDFAPPFSAAGMWRASDRRGTVTLFIDEIAPPAPVTGRVGIVGKGTLTDLLNQSVGVTMDGHYALYNIQFALLGPDGDTLAKGWGTFTADRLAFKVEMVYGNGSKRGLTFVRF